MKTQTRLFLFFLLSCFAFLPSLSAEQRELNAGFHDNWSIISSFSHTRLQQGKEGFLDIELEYSRYEPDSTATDILLHFEKMPFSDSAGKYSVTSPGTSSLVRQGRIGESAVFFPPDSGGIILKPRESVSRHGAAQLFQPGRLWKDFTIEFWLQPKYLEGGETILRWNGQRETPDGVQQQLLKCFVQDRRIVWYFNNFFLHPDSRPASYSFTGQTNLVPGKWSHHLLRFDADTGMLEYQLNGTPESIMYITSDSSPGSTVLLPYIGKRSSSQFTLAEDYAGMMDEFRFSSIFVEQPLFQRHPIEGGEVIFGPIPLEELGSEILSIDLDTDEPPGSSIFSYYRTADRRYDFALEDPQWIPFSPGESFDPEPSGSYLQIKCVLYPDGTGMMGPKISHLKVRYRPNLPPPAPVGFMAVPGDGKVKLSWKLVNQQDLGGYLIFYGLSSGVYRGQDSDKGPSPIDVGLSTEFELTSLKNGTLYFFTVAAYDTQGVEHRGNLSRELSARPSAYYGEE